MFLQINFLLVFILSLASSRHVPKVHYSTPDHDEANTDITVVDCHTDLHGDVLGYRYRLDASTAEDGRICDLRIPAHVLVAIETDFHDPATYFRVVGTSGNQGWTVALPKVYKNNSTIPHHGHERKHTSIWFTPCERSAILLNSKSPKDGLIFMMKELSADKRDQYTDPMKCDDDLDIF